MFYDVCVHKSDRLDVRMLDFFLMCSARSKRKLKMKGLLNVKGTVSGSGTGPLDYGATGPVPDTEPRL